MTIVAEAETHLLCIRPRITPRSANAPRLSGKSLSRFEPQRRRCLAALLLLTGLALWLRPNRQSRRRQCPRSRGCESTAP